MPQAIAKPTFPRLRRGSRFANGLVGAWLFYEGAGPTLYELSESNHAPYNGTFAAASPTWTGGGDGMCLHFVAASSQYVALPAATQTAYSFTNTTATVFARAKIGSNVIVACDGQAVTIAGWFLQGTGGAVNFQAKGGGGNSIVLTTSAIYNDGNYHDIVAVFSTNTAVAGGNTGTIYVDGAFATNTNTGNQVYTAAATAASIGARGAGASVFYDGDISCIYLWNRPLDLSEISLLSYDPYSMFRRRQIVKPSADQIFAFDQTGARFSRNITTIGY